VCVCLSVRHRALYNNNFNKRMVTKCIRNNREAQLRPVALLAQHKHARLTFFPFVQVTFGGGSPVNLTSTLNSCPLLSWWLSRKLSRSIRGLTVTFSNWCTDKISNNWASERKKPNSCITNFAKFCTRLTLFLSLFELITSPYFVNRIYYISLHFISFQLSV